MASSISIGSSTSPASRCGESPTAMARSASGRLTTMEELAADPVVAVRLRFIREALLLGASVQLRNMATIGGNLLQRTRCRYFRDPTVAACNKRSPGSGCAAIDGFNRMHAILGTSEQCIALHASDLAIPLIALDAIVHVQGQDGERSIPLTEFYREPGDTPQVENVLGHGELITAVDIPFLPEGARSHYLKVRDRASYEFALASAGVALVIANGAIAEARIGLGGVGTIPWRAPGGGGQSCAAAPARMETFRAAAEAALADLHGPGNTRSRLSWPSAPWSGTPCGSGIMTVATKRSCNGQPRRRGCGSGGWSLEGVAAPRPIPRMSVSRTWPTPYWCGAPSPLAVIAASMTAAAHATPGVLAVITHQNGAAARARSGCGLLGPAPPPPAAGRPHPATTASSSPSWSPRRLMRRRRLRALVRSITSVLTPRCSSSRTRVAELVANPWSTDMQRGDVAPALPQRRSSTKRPTRQRRTRTIRSGSSPRSPSGMATCLTVHDATQWPILRAGHARRRCSGSPGRAVRVRRALRGRWLRRRHAGLAARDPAGVGRARRSSVRSSSSSPDRRCSRPSATGQTRSAAHPHRGPLATAS